MENALNITAYRVHSGFAMPIVPASSHRQWMDLTGGRFAYRCLPMLISNQHGWFLSNMHHVRAVWDGREHKDAVTITCLSGPEGAPCPMESHFGHGVITWNIGYLFRTPPGYNLWVRGPSNWPKAGVCPLEGIVETDWTAATFTMNWKITDVDQPVYFEPGEPICMIMPIRRGEVERFNAAIEPLANNDVLCRAYQVWAVGRSKFNQELFASPPGDPNKWQKHYFAGFGPDGSLAPEHQTKLVLSDFSLPEE
jgi:hypothetical protein